jgi:hypothetical protein
MKTQNKQTLTSEKAKDLVDRIGPSLGSDLTYDPEFPKTRKDVCVVRRLAEDGSTYGFDTIYLLWNKGNEIKYEELTNSRSSKDYINIESVVETKEDIVVKIYSGGSYSGQAWKDSIKRSKRDLGLK